MSLFLMLIFFTCLYGVFDGCKVGWYGQNCSETCPNFCRNNECNPTTGKCLHCVTGYYSDNYQECIRCPNHCTICNSNDFCFACETGYKGKVCDEMCTNCKPDTRCDKNTGYCVDYCTEGLSGELCNVECNFKCKSCARDNKDKCFSCADDEKGNVCKEECFNQCLRSTCKGSHESCTYECSSGYPAEITCNMTCLSHCKDRVCNITCTETVLQDIPSSPTNTASYGYVLGIVFVLIFLTGASIIVNIHVRKSSSQRYKWCNDADDNNTSKKEVSRVPEEPSKTKCHQRLQSADVEEINENKENGNTKKNEGTENSPAEQTEPGDNFRKQNIRANSNHNNTSPVVSPANANEQSKETYPETGPSSDVKEPDKSKEKGYSKKTDTNPARKRECGDNFHSSNNNTSLNNAVDAIPSPRSNEDICNQPQPSTKTPTFRQMNDRSIESEPQHDQQKLDYGNNKNGVENSFMTRLFTPDAIEVAEEADNGETETPNENHEANSSDKLVSDGPKLQVMNKSVDLETAPEETKPLLNSGGNNDKISKLSDACTGQNNDPNKMVAQDKGKSSSKSCQIS